ncbi:TPA: hypothetical protein N0F65_002094 [Lagenidium giganteum]|uniref:Uncharacterized protein n=1 Tax=Lagenidium giganteum TaxID=4803 RepID=A0AAV2ZH38_9STRA|nr:TPA: hypothetical protein N0F65_002094 [Lagenidium giganteum]
MMATSVDVGGRLFELSETLEADELAPIFDDAWTASRVWRASRFLADHLVACSRSADASAFHGVLADDGGAAGVVELGSGCGLAGLVAASLGADVLLTDQHQAIDLLERNVAANAATADERARLTVREYTWGQSVALLRPTAVRPVDYILVSDCINPIYGTESWRNLARSIHALSSIDTITYLAHEQRGEDEAWQDFVLFSGNFLSHQEIAREDKLRLFKITRRQAEASPQISSSSSIACTRRKLSSTLVTVRTHAPMESPRDAASVGIYWGPSGCEDQPAPARAALSVAGSTARLPPVRDPRHRTKPAGNRLAAQAMQKAAQIKRSGVVLPPILDSVSQPQQQQTATPGAREDTGTQSLLQVLRTLMRSVQRDVDRFGKAHQRVLDMPTAQLKAMPPQYFSSLVEVEDRSYFDKEREMTAARDQIDANSTWARQLHCATDDGQHYAFDRQRQLDRRDIRRAKRKAKLAHEQSMQRIENARYVLLSGHLPQDPSGSSHHGWCCSENRLALQQRLIDQNVHKTEHLMHVLQQEIANETQRELREYCCSVCRVSRTGTDDGCPAAGFLEVWRPERAPSRQSRKRMATIVRERFETADRVMRILEEYHIVVAIEAAAYLKQTIEQGRAFAAA